MLLGFRLSNQKQPLATRMLDPETRFTAMLADWDLSIPALPRSFHICPVLVTSVVDAANFNPATAGCGPFRHNGFLF